MRVWIVHTKDPTTGEVSESFVIDTTDQDEPEFVRSQQERFGDRFRGAKLQTCVESS